jgi:hypothetical protein
MDMSLLIAIALFAILVLTRQSAWRGDLKLQNNISTKALGYLNRNWMAAILEFLSLAAILVTVLGSYFHPAVSLFAVVIAILSTWELFRISRTESDPFHLLAGYQNEAKKCIAQNNEPELCDWIEAIHEINYKAVRNANVSLASAGIETQLLIGKQFLSESNTLDLPRIGYVLHFLYERLKSLFELCLRENHESLCVQVNTTFGKLALHAMGTHPHFAGAALVTAGNLAEKAVRGGAKDVAIKTSLMLIELCHTVANEAPLDDKDLGDAMVEVVKTLETISKELYRQDKSIPLEVIRAPFLQLKTALASSPNANHPTVVLSLHEVDRVLAEYQELELILKTIPPIT